MVSTAVTSDVRPTVNATSPANTMSLFGSSGRRDTSRRKVASASHQAIGAAGITAAFNLNLLTRINHELSGTFDLSQFAHYACYNEAMGRIEMHLTSLIAQRVQVSGKTFPFAAGERIHTENSYKYHPTEFITLASAAGFSCEQYWTDADNLFGLYYCTVRA